MQGGVRPPVVATRAAVEPQCTAPVDSGLGATFDAIDFEELFSRRQAEATPPPPSDGLISRGLGKE